MSFADWVSERLGTRMWVVSVRLTSRLAGKGYDKAVTPQKYRELMRNFETETGQSILGRETDK